jgi:iron complex transport system ATP-binding protein
VRSALERCRVAELADRPFATLSGGERQRARLARALAQEPEALALDEPTASLDVAHEMEIWEILREEAAAGRAVLLTTHHLNLAARYADRLVLIDRGRVAAAGRPHEVLTADTVSAVYRWPVRIERLDEHAGDGVPQVVPIQPSIEEKR